MKLLNGLSLQTYLGIEPPLIRYHLARHATAASFLLNFKVVMGLEVQPKVLADSHQAEWLLLSCLPCTRIVLRSTISSR
jgi:hypothetical protein